FLVAESGSGEKFDGVLIVGEDGSGTLEVSDTQTFFTATAIVGQNDGASGEITVDNSVWGGNNLTVGAAGTGTVSIENGSTAAINSVLVGPDGDLSLSSPEIAPSTLLTNFLTLSFGTIDVTGNGELMVGAASGTPGAIAIGGTEMVGPGALQAAV